MILPINGINCRVSLAYRRIQEELKKLGLTPTGNEQVDRSMLARAKQKEVEKFYLKKAKEGEAEEAKLYEKLEHEKTGAQEIATWNRIFHHI